MLYHEAMNALQKSRITLLPLVMTALVIVLDQLSKYMIIVLIPQDSYADIKKVIGEFLWIVHVRNTGAAFSLGSGLESTARVVVLFVIPVALIVYLLYASTYMKWQLRFKFLSATIAGGGIGNMIDRFIRPDGVVDFVSVKLYGLFGIERWPTFNIADTAIVISMAVWLFFVFFTKEARPAEATPPAGSASPTVEATLPAGSTPPPSEETQAEGTAADEGIVLPRV